MNKIFSTGFGEMFMASIEKSGVANVLLTTKLSNPNKEPDEEVTVNDVTSLQFKLTNALPEINVATSGELLPPTGVNV